MSISRVENLTKQLAGLFSYSSKNMTYSQKEKAKKLLEDIVNLQFQLEVENTKLKSKLAKTDHAEYDTLLQHYVNILIALDVDQHNAHFTFKKPYIDFILKNKDSIGKISIERLISICDLIKFHEVVLGFFPENTNDLKNASAELIELRKGDYDVDKLINELSNMTKEQINERFESEKNKY